jgi:hypothetical protein
MKPTAPLRNKYSVCHDTLDFVSVPGFPSAIETRSFPTLTRSYPRRLDTL